MQLPSENTEPWFYEGLGCTAGYNKASLGRLTYGTVTLTKDLQHFSERDVIGDVHACSTPIWIKIPPQGRSNGLHPRPIRSRAPRNHRDRSIGLQSWSSWSRASHSHPRPEQRAPPTAKLKQTSTHPNPRPEHRAPPTAKPEQGSTWTIQGRSIGLLPRQPKVGASGSSHGQHRRNSPAGEGFHISNQGRGNGLHVRTT